MKITILIKSGDTARLTDGVRLVLGLTINHRVSVLITGTGADAVARALEDKTFQGQFLESLELIAKMSGMIKMEKAIPGLDAIAVVSKETLTELLLQADSIIVW